MQSPNECFCQSLHAEHRDVLIGDARDYETLEFLEGKPFYCQASNGAMVYFKTEKAAAKFQRRWRELMGLHPMTGEFDRSINENTWRDYVRSKVVNDHAVVCNRCNWFGGESEIPHSEPENPDSAEYCPSCGHQGGLMDIDKEASQ